MALRSLFKLVGGKKKRTRQPAVEIRLPDENTYDYDCAMLTLPTEILLQVSSYLDSTSYMALARLCLNYYYILFKSQPARIKCYREYVHILPLYRINITSWKKLHKLLDDIVPQEVDRYPRKYITQQFENKKGGGFIKGEKQQSETNETYVKMSVYPTHTVVEHAEKVNGQNPKTVQITKPWAFNGTKAQCMFGYFEVEMHVNRGDFAKRKGGGIAIGLAREGYRLNAAVGWQRFSYALHSDDWGKFFSQGRSDETFAKTTKLTNKEVIGCGLFWNGVSIWTHNSRLVELGSFIIEDPTLLFPTVTVLQCRDRAIINMGKKPFLFDAAGFLKKYKAFIEDFPAIQQQPHVVRQKLLQAVRSGSRICHVNCTSFKKYVGKRKAKKENTEEIDTSSGSYSTSFSGGAYSSSSSSSSGTLTDSSTISESSSYEECVKITIV